MKKMILFLLMTMVAAGVAFSAGQQEGDSSKSPVEVYYFGASRSDKSGITTAINMAFERLKESNPGVEYSQTGVPYTAYWDQLTLDITSGTEKDVIIVDSPTSILPYHQLRAGGSFMDLSDAVASSDVLSGLSGLQMGKFQGEMLSVPAVLTSWAGIWYRKSHFKAAGIDPMSIKTWDDLLDASKKLTIDKNNDGKLDQFGMGFGSVNEPMTRWWSQQFFWTLGGGWFEDDTNGPYTKETLNFDSPQNIATLTYLKALKDEGTPPGTRSHDDARVLYGGGVLSMMLDGSFGSGSIKNVNEETYADTDVFPFPGAEFQGKSYKPVSPFWGLSWAVSNNAKNKEGALLFLEEYYSKPAQEYLANYQIPPAPSALDAFSKVNAKAAKFIEWGASDDFVQVGFPINDHFNEMDKIHDAVVANVLQNVMSPEEAAAWGQSEMERVMK